MTPESWMNQFVGKPVDGGECLAWSSYYSRNYLGISTDIGNVAGAAQMFDHAPDANFIKIENNPQDYNQHPEEGDIIIWHAWTGNIYGHTGVCSYTFNGSNGISYDQNWSERKVKREYHDYGNIRGWLRPRNRFWLVDPQIAIDAANAAAKAETDRIAAEKAIYDANYAANKLAAENAAKAAAAQKEIADAQAKLEEQRIAEKVAEDARLAQVEADRIKSEQAASVEVTDGFWARLAALIITWIKIILGKE